MGKSSNREEFIKKSIKIWGGLKFDYSKAVYIKNNKHVLLGCLTNHEHGFFLISPKHHLYKRGCPKCGGTSKSNTEDFIRKAIIKHGIFKFGYDEVNYI